MTSQNKKPKTKFCKSCQKRKAIKNFPKRYDKSATQGQLSPECRKCRQAKISKRKSKLRELVRQYKASKGCKICGYNDERALVLHHKDRKEKTLEVSNMISRAYAQKTIFQEVEKCDVLCQNCHSILHHEEAKKK